DFACIREECRGEVVEHGSERHSDAARGHHDAAYELGSEGARPAPSLFVGNDVAMHRRDRARFMISRSASSRSARRRARGQRRLTALALPAPRTATGRARALLFVRLQSSLGGAGSGNSGVTETISEPVSADPNVLDRDFEASAPNRRWIGVTTER